MEEIKKNFKNPEKYIGRYLFGHGMISLMLKN